MSIQADQGGGTTIRSTIAEVLETVAKEQRLELPPLADNLPLAATGLDSLSFAIVVARLEEKFGEDPFSDPDGQTPFPVTFGDLVRLYGNGSR